MNLVYSVLFIFVIPSVSSTRRTCTGSLNGAPYCYYEIGYGSNIIISAPHGGSLKPSKIPDRTNGHTLKDWYTKEIAIALADELKKTFGKRPHLIVNNLHRVKLDANRAYDEATGNNKISGEAYNTYHRFIQSAKDSIKGPGLFIDIHGQAHPEGWVELGYQVTRTRLNNDTPNWRSSSLKALVDRGTVKFETVLRGSRSLGHFLQQESIETIPSPKYMRPGSGNYFIGGYNTNKHGSRYSGQIDGIQIELPSKYRRSSTKTKIVTALAKAIYRFMQINSY